jgi:hypothetical protein
MKEEKTNRTKWLHIRLTEDEHKTISDGFKETTCRKISDYARRILFAKKITTLTRNQSLDDFMTEMIRLRNEMSAIGNNWNQAVKRLHTLDHSPEIKVWIISTQKVQQAVLEKTEEIKNKIGKISDQWLQ